MSRRFSTDTRSFTLLELTLVLLMLGILLGVAAPALRGFVRGRETEEEARRLLALSRHARSEAIANADVVELWLEPSAGAYGVRSLLTGRNGTLASATEVLPNEITLVIEREGAPSGEPFSLIWSPDGALAYADLLAIQLLSAWDTGDCPVLVPDPLRNCLVVAAKDTQ